VEPVENAQEIPVSSYIKFKNDSERLQYEWEELKETNPTLVEIIEKIAEFTGQELDKNVMITMIGRTSFEQDDIYGGKTRSDGRVYDKKPWKSPHQFDHAIDIRSREYTEDEIKDIEELINSEYDTENYYRWTTKDHTVGKGWHFHVQYYKV